jgi:hypothetical protein
MAIQDLLVISEEAHLRRPGRSRGRRGPLQPRADEASESRRGGDSDDRATTADWDTGRRPLRQLELEGRLLERRRADEVDRHHESSGEGPTRGAGFEVPVENGGFELG